MPYSKNRIRTCQWCKKNYSLGIESTQHKYCSIECRQKWHYDRWRSNGGKRDPKKSRSYWLNHYYGITIEEYEKIFKKQNYCCEICGIKQIKAKNFHVDHCHKTLKIRSILCNKCNAALGLVNEDINILEKIINYLKKHNG